MRSASGIRPVRPQLLHDHHFKVVSSGLMDGMLPSKEFSSIHSVVREGNERSVSGISPLRAFLLRLSTSKF